MSSTPLKNATGADEDVVRTMTLRNAFAGALPGLPLSHHRFGGFYPHLIEAPFVAQATVDPSYDLGGSWYQVYAPAFLTEQTTFGVLQDPVDIAAYPTQADVMLALEDVRQRLDLTTDEAARLIGVGTRSYLGYKSGDSSMPLSRMQTAMNAAMVLGCLAASRWEATRRVLTTDAGSSELIATGQFATLRGLVDRAQADIDREYDSLVPALDAVPSLPEGLDPEAVLATLRSPQFEALMPYIDAFAPGLQSGDAVSRVVALLELEAAVERLHAGDPLGEDYMFLSPLRAAEIDGLLRRAREVLRATSPDSGWQAFIESEAEAAWSKYSLEIAGPVIDLREVGDDAAYAVRDVADLGFDLVTGRPHEAR